MIKENKIVSQSSIFVGERMMMRIVLLILVLTCSCFDFLEEPKRGCWWDYGSGERVKKCDASALALALALSENAEEEVINKNYLLIALSKANPDLLATALGLAQTTALAGVSKLSVSQIFGNSGEECRCSDFTVRRKNGFYEGKCLSKFKGYYWCYLEKNGKNCRDRTFKNGRYWSFSACYLE